MMVEPGIKARTAEARDKLNRLWVKRDAGRLTTDDASIVEMLKLEIEMLKAEALAILASRQQGPW